MYQTSEAYRQALDNGYLDTRIEGTITTVQGTVIPFADRDIVPGSLKINTKAVNGNDFSFGGVYVGELSVSLMADINRYSLNGARVEGTYYLKTGDQEQSIPLGAFFVYEATRAKRIISIKAYDAMTKLDIEITEATNGLMFDILTYISEMSGVELAQGEQEISQFINSDIWLIVDPEHVSTYREAVSQIATLAGRFATINREGKLEFREFNTETVSDKVPAKRRTSSDIADYSTFFCGVRAGFRSDNGYIQYEAIDELVERGLILDIGDVSIFLGEDTTKNSIMDNLLGVVKRIDYIPLTYEGISDPSLDVGDTLELINISNTDYSARTLLLSYDWTYHGTQKITSYGLDPLAAGVVSKDAKILSKIESQLSSKSLVVKTYTNSRKLSISGSREQEVLLINFATTESTTVMLMLTIPFEASLDGTVVLNTYMDGVLDETAMVSEYVDRGSHVITVSNYFPMKANGRATLKVGMSVEYTESAIREHDAKIVSILNYIDTGELPDFVPDTTVPTITIKKSAIKGLLFAQGMAGAGQWDGTINAVDYLSPTPIEVLTVFDEVRVGRFSDSASVEATHYVGRVLSQQIGRHTVTLDETVVRSFNESNEFDLEEIPHGDGADGFIPIIVGGAAITLGTLDDSATAEING